MLKHLHISEKLLSLQKISVQMATIFNQHGFNFLIYSNDHDPVHVHVKGHDGEAKIVLQGQDVIVERQTKIKKSDMKRIKKAVRENAILIRQKWREFQQAKA